MVCATVEVYSNETSQWYSADPLPAPYYVMSSITIADTCYLLGGLDADGKTITTVLYASLTSLVQKATSPTHQSASRTSVWKTLPDTPLKVSTAASLSGNLLAVGGHDTKTVFSAINIFLPLTNSWVRIMTGDLPQPQNGCSVAQLSSNTMIVIGGVDNQGKSTKTVFIGTVTVLNSTVLLLSSFDYPDIVRIETFHFCTFPLVISFTILTILTQNLMYETEEVVCL